MAPKDETQPAPTPTWTAEEFAAVVAAGLSIQDAKFLRDEGYAAEAALSIAEKQAQTRIQQSADAQTATAKAMQKAMRPENETHPGISALSYPEGDLARPRIMPSFAVSVNGYPASKFPETEHWRDLELMALLTPGEYTVLRKDFTTMKVTVAGETDADGKLVKVDVLFPVTRETKGLVAPITVLLYQLVYATPDNPRKAFTAAMAEYMRVMFGDVALA
jgi:hypothetical protein